MTVSSIYVISPAECSGKTSIIVSMAIKARELGKSVGYFKPIGYRSPVEQTEEHIDDDAKNIKEILGLEEEPDVLCPVVIDKQDFLKNISQKNEIRKRIIECYKKVSKGKDLLLIEGPHSISGGISIDCAAPDLAREFGSRIIVAANAENDSFMEELLLTVKFCERYSITPAGAILNKVSDYYSEVESAVKSILEKEGIELLGSIPKNEILGSPRVLEIVDSIGGDIIAGREGLGNIVQNLMIGAMSLESAMKHFRKSTKKLVIVGGDRTDIISAALETGASAVVVTGNLYPSVKILPKADELKTPVLLVPYDTYTALSMIQKIVGKIKPNDRAKIDVIKKFGANINLDKIMN
ncbi:MAG: AAA family ATPase [Candidatus Hadarchaeales archaeon]